MFVEKEMVNHEGPFPLGEWSCYLRAPILHVLSEPDRVDTSESLRCCE